MKPILCLLTLLVASGWAGSHALAGTPAARIGDNHVCPMVTGPVPHVGGPVIQGAPTVLTCGKPAARIGDQATCAGGAPDSITIGSATVLIGGKPAARVGSSTAHGGRVLQGCPTVLIGD